MTDSEAIFAHANGWDAVFFGTMLIALSQAVLWMSRHPKVTQHGWMVVAHVDSIRILSGMVVLFLGIAARILDAFLRRSLIPDAGLTVLAVRDLFGEYLIVGGAALAVLGTTLIMWPTLRRIFGVSGVIVVVVGAGAMYLVGAMLTDIIPHLVL